MPKKPTQPFGHIAFGKDGSVTKHVTRLSDDKSVQESEAFSYFVKTYTARFPNHQMKVVAQLPEQDHDFVAEIGGKKITIQLTELVDRSFVNPMSQAEYDSGAFPEAILKVSGERPWKVNAQNRDSALAELIASKAARYAKSADALWLVVYCTIHYEMAYWHKGQYFESQALQNARAKVGTLKHNPFEQAWFTDMQTNPIAVWPKVAQPGVPGDGPRPAGSARG